MGLSGGNCSSSFGTSRLRSSRCSNRGSSFFYPADNSLCLYYPGDLTWSDKHHLYDKTIPWLVEWLVFYELYQITGS